MSLQWVEFSQFLRCHEGIFHINLVQSKWLIYSGANHLNHHCFLHHNSTNTHFFAKLQGFFNFIFGVFFGPSALIFLLLFLSFVLVVLWSILTLQPTLALNSWSFNLNFPCTELQACAITIGSALHFSSNFQCKFASSNTYITVWMLGCIEIFFARLISPSLLSSAFYNILGG